MKRNRNKYTAYLFLGSSLLLQGCSPNEEELWGLGSFVFVFFVAILFLNSIVPRIQEFPRLQELVTKLEFLSEKIWPLILLIAIISILTGAYSIATNGPSSIKSLFIFTGVIILYLAVNVRAWGRSKDTLKKRNHLRKIGLSVSFLVIYGYLLNL
jgi:hypothetical protein